VAEAVGGAEEAKRIAITTRLFYGVGSVAEGVKNTAFNVFLLFYYNQVLGLSGTLSGAAIFIALCVDAVTDPLVGSLSDNTHSRWGRRHPYMYSAALPMAFCFVLLFHPPALGATGLFVWLTVFAVGVRASMTLYAIPSGSMLPELTPNYHERTTLVSYRFLFGWFGGLVMSLLGYLYFFAPKAGFEDGRLDASAYGGFSWVGAAMILAAILACSGGTHRLIPTLCSPPDASPLTLARFAGEVRDVASNRSYRMLVMASLLASAALGFNEVVGLYMNTYFWGFSTDQISVLVMGLFVSVILAFLITRPLTERYDKKRSALGLAFFAVCFGPLPVFLRLLELMPANGDPLLLWIIAGHAAMLVTAFVAITIIVSSMLADVADENELATGKRQEGMLISAIAFTNKATSGLGGLMAGIALDLIAFPRGVDPGMVPPDKIFKLGLAVGPGMMLLFVLTLVFFSRYRITSARYHEIQAQLSQRRERALDLGATSP